MSSKSSTKVERDAKIIKKAGGGPAEIQLVGAGIVEEPTHLIRIPRVR